LLDGEFWVFGEAEGSEERGLTTTRRSWQVDADTKVYPDSLGYLVRTMQNDNMIMGVCGETRIANKRQSWVTMIQVFE